MVKRRQGELILNIVKLGGGGILPSQFCSFPKS
jgi:hypothetical protein